MVIVYNEEKELYYKIYACVIDIHDEWEDYDISSGIFSLSKENYDSVRGAYKVTDNCWEEIKEILDKWINSKGYFRTYDEEKHYEIEQATPLYKVYNKCDEWCNEDWEDTLDDVKTSFLDNPMNELMRYRVVPYPANECHFRPKLQRWSGFL